MTNHEQDKTEDLQENARVVTYLDVEGAVITAEEFWHLVERITLEGDTQRM